MQLNLATIKLINPVQSLATNSYLLCFNELKKNSDCRKRCLVGRIFSRTSTTSNKYDENKIRSPTGL